MNTEWAWRVGLAIAVPIAVLAMGLIMALACVAVAAYAPFHFLLHRDALDYQGVGPVARTKAPRDGRRLCIMDSLEN